MDDFLTLGFSKVVLLSTNPEWWNSCWAGKHLNWLSISPDSNKSRRRNSLCSRNSGTTISPYLFFWQTSEEVEEEKVAGQSTLAKRRGATLKELELRNTDVGVGTFFSMWSCSLSS
jgi:hypothetical protein